MPPASSELIAKLFARLQVRYGHRWVSLYPSEEMTRIAAAEWAHGLAEYSLEEIAHGLRTWRGEWPPNLPEFQNACRERVKACHRHYQALPPPEPDRGKALHQLEQMRSALRA